MLTEQQIRDTYTKYFPNADILTSDPITPDNCVLPYFTAEELELQCQRMANPTIENNLAAIATDKEVFSRAMASGTFKLPLSPVPYELSVEYEAEQARLNSESE